MFCALLSVLAGRQANTTPEEAKQAIQTLQKAFKKLNGWLKDLKSERSDVEKASLKVKKRHSKSC